MKSKINILFKKISILLWFFLHPNYYQHLLYLVVRKFLPNHDKKKDKNKALKWASSNAVRYVDVFKKLGLKGNLKGLDKNTIAEGLRLQNKSSLKMGGAAHIHLLYDCVRLIKAKRVLETGVAYGWSSLSILKALHDNQKGRLYSIDMPYPVKNNEKNVGIVVPNYLKKKWKLIRRPDRPGINIGLKKAGGKIDLCHYDSDKSWWGRAYAYNILWNSLKSNGVFITDDIQDNLYFFEFVKKKSSKFAIVEYEKKFIGLIRKP